MKEIDASFREWANSYDRMKWSRVGALFRCKKLIGQAFFDGLHTIFEDRGPKLSSTQYFVGGSHTRKMTSTISRVTVI